MTAPENSPLIANAGGFWTAATSARFLDAVADGTLPPEAFQRWLVQDYFFAQGLARVQGAMLAKAPRPAFGPLIDGLGALQSELEWFESHAQRLGLRLTVERHPACTRYVDFLVATVHHEPFPVLAAMLFGVEVAYLAAWGALPAAGPYVEFIERWSNPAFAQYVRALRRLAEEQAVPAQQAVFNEVLRHERDFWRMTWEG